MCGYKTITNYSPVRYVLPKNLEHASKMALGNKPFMDWTRWSDVRELSKAFFRDGEPYEMAITTSLDELEEMKTIRNAIAHRSDNASTKFLKLVRNKIGHHPRGVTPGGFLTMPSGLQPGIILDDYVNSLLTIVNYIVP